MRYFQVKCNTCNVTAQLPTNLNNSLNTKGWKSFKDKQSEEYKWVCPKCEVLYIVP